MINFKTTLCLLLGSLGALAADGGEAAASVRPNVILIMTDDQGYGQMGAHGQPWLKTPALDSLHATSVRFSQFMVSPTCAPTRAALMTGRHPLECGVTHTILQRERLAPGLRTLPEMLSERGYVSGIFGKWHLGDEAKHQPSARGFNEVFIHGAGGIGQAYGGSCADVPKNKYQNPVVRHNGSFVQTNGFCTDVFFSAAINWMDGERKKDRPFFAYISTNAPHGPFIAPEKSRERFEACGFPKAAAGFYGMIENIDENVGRLMDQLENWNLLENTVVIFLSDNGTTSAGSGRLKKLGVDQDGKAMMGYNAGMKGFKGSPDEGGVRVPFFVRWDGKFKGDRDVDVLSAHIDLVPTLVDLTGGEAPTGLRGRSLLPLLEGSAERMPDRLLFTHVARWPKGDEPNEYRRKKFSVRSEQFRLVGEDALYDMQSDPAQTTNVAAQHPEVVKNMLARYDAFWDKARPLMVNEEEPLAEERPFWVDYQRQLESEGGIPDWDGNQ